MFSEDDVNDTGQVPPGGSSEGSRHESSTAEAGGSGARARVAARPGGGTSVAPVPPILASFRHNADNTWNVRVSGAEQGAGRGTRDESSSADEGRSDARARVAARPGGGTAGPSRDESSTARAGPSDARAQVADRPGGGAVAVDEDMEIEEELSTGRVLGENFIYNLQIIYSAQIINIYVMVYISRRISLPKYSWKNKVPRLAEDFIVNIS